MAFVHYLKQRVEAAFGLRIYRSATPLGLDLNNDLKRLVPQFQPRVIFDVGANVGQTSLYFNKLWPDAEIYAFEPVSATYEELTRAVAGQKSKIHCVQVALSDETGQAEIRLSERSVFATLDPTFTLPGSNFGRIETVLKVTADDWCNSNGVKHIDLLKVDAEGHDLHVLKGAGSLFEQQRISAVLIEIHMGPSPGPTLDTIRAWLEPRGYIPCGIYDLEGYASKKLLYGNFLFLPYRMIPQ